MKKRSKEGLIKIAINIAVMVVCYVLIQLKIWGLFPGLVMMASFFSILLIAVRYFVYGDKDSVDDIIDDSAKSFSSAAAKGMSMRDKQ